MINNTDFKQFILGSTIGKIFFSARSFIKLWKIAYSLPERLGMIANDRLSTLLVTNICQSNKTFIDVGAHIGSIISSVAENPSIKIVAIEAIPEKAAKLRKKFPSVEIHGCAVGDKKGEVSFFINIKQSGYSSLIKPTNSATSLVKEIRIPINKLDELVVSNDIDVIKIDVEGAELGVLIGGKNIIEENRPIIMFESGAEKINALNYTKKALWQFFTELNYRIHIPNRVAHNDDGLSEEGFIESHIYPRRTTNYFAIPKERRLEVRDKAREILKIRVE